MAESKIPKLSKLNLNAFLDEYYQKNYGITYAEGDSSYRVPRGPRYKTAFYEDYIWDPLDVYKKGYATCMSNIWLYEEQYNESKKIISKRRDKRMMMLCATYCCRIGWNGQEMNIMLLISRYLAYYCSKVTYIR